MCMYTCVQVCMNVPACVCEWLACICVCMCACMCVAMGMYVHLYLDFIRVHKIYYELLILCRRVF